MVQRSDTADLAAMGARIADVENACAAALALLTARAPGATVCPSEVARALVAAGGATVTTDWRDMMPAVHAAVDQMVPEGIVRLSWKGERLTTRSGPYRIGRGKRDFERLDDLTTPVIGHNQATE